MAASQIVLLLRHGETELNRSGALRGRLEVPLTETGRQQARRLGERIAAGYRLERIVASPLRRTIETAEAVSAATGAPVFPAGGFVDADYGRWSGRPASAMLPDERAELERWRRDPSMPLPGAEPPEQMQARALAALDEVAAHDLGVAAVVSHDAVIQLILCRVLRLPLATYLGITQQPATLNQLRRVESAWAVELLNSSWHVSG